MAEKKTEKKLTPEEFEAEHARLREEVKKAQQELWDHVHPVIEDPQLVAQAEYKKLQAEEQKKAAKKAE